MFGNAAAPPGQISFWHIPKTAGTSFIAWLDSHYPPDRVYSGQLLPQLDIGNPTGFGLVRGHLRSAPLTLMYQCDAPPPLTVTILREPRARTLSHLAHVWREPNHYLHERLRERPTVLQALADPLLRVAMTDVQARFLGTDPLPFRQSHPPLDVGDFLK